MPAINFFVEKKFGLSSLFIYGVLLMIVSLTTFYEKQIERENSDLEM